MRDRVVTMILLIMAIVIIALTVFIETDKPDPVSDPPGPTPIIYIDHSARTGFLSSEDFMARFETIEFPVAGSDELHTVCRIDVYRWPDVEYPIEYITDSFDEAVEFLYGLGGCYEE